MPDDEKPAGEPAPSGENPETRDAKAAAEATKPGESEKPSAENAPLAARPGETPTAAIPEVPVSPQSGDAAAAGEKPAKPVPAKKPVSAAAEGGVADAAAGDKPAVEKPAAKPAAAKPAKAEGEKPAAKKVPTTMEATPWEGPLVDRLRQHFAAEINECSIYLGDPFAVVKLPAAFAVLQYLKAEAGFDYLVDVTAVHYPQKPKPFEVIWILYSYPHNTRVRVKTELSEGESPRSVDSLYASANWLEREVYDMFGISFAEHPNMTRILLPDGWQGHPLRKDYSIIQQDQDWVHENINIESGQ